MSVRRTQRLSGELKPVLLRVGEVAALLGISEREVWNMLHRRELRRIVIPGRRMTRVRRDEVERLVEAWDEDI
jgi:excisionase family DNA binding protein